MTATVATVAFTFGVSKELARSYMATSLRDPNSSIYKEVAKAVADDMRKRSDREYKHKRTVPYVMSVEEEDSVRALFPEMYLVFNSHERKTHGPFWSVIYLMKEVVYSLLPSETEPVTEYSMEFAQTAFRGRTATYNVVPIRYTIDYAWYSAQVQHLNVALSRMKTTTREYRSVYKFMDDIDARVFKNGSRPPQTGYAIVDHCTHEVPLEQVATLAIQSGHTIVYGFFVFDIAMLDHAKGRIYDLAADFCVEDGRLYLMYGNDSAACMSYDHDAYIQLATANHVRIGDHTFSYELFDRRGSIYLYRMIYLGELTEAELGETTATHPLWCNDADAGYDVTCSVPRSEYCDLTDLTNYKKKVMVAPSRLTEELLMYACTMNEADMNYENIHKYAVVINKKFILDGVSVHYPKGIDPDSLTVVARAVYEVAYELRYDQHVVYQNLKKSLKAREVLSTAGILRLTAKGMSAAIRNGWRFVRDSLPSVTFSDGDYSDYTVASISQRDRYKLFSSVIRRSGKAETIIDRFNPAYRNNLHYVTFVLKNKRKFLDQFMSKLREYAPTIDTAKSRERLRGIAAELIKRAVQYEFVPEVSDNNTEPAEGAHEIATRLNAENGGFVKTGPDYYVPQPIKQPTVKDVKVTPTKIVNATAVMQEYYDKIFPGLSHHSKLYDAKMVNEGDLKMTISAIRLRISPSKLGYLRDKKFYKANVRTNICPDRPKHLKELIIATDKRNLNVPLLETPADLSVIIRDTFEKFFDKFCVPGAKEMCAKMRENPVTLTEQNAELWSKRATADTIRQLRGQGLTVTDKDIGRYTASLKPEVKARCENNMSEYSALQTIVHHPKDVNAYFSPIIMELRSRLRQILRPDVLLNMQKNREEIEKFLNDHEVFNCPVNYLENDFSKYDKSQQYRCILLEWAFYEYIGINISDLIMWQDGHLKVSMEALMLGLKILSILQRLSGDSTTAFGNTVVNMLTVAAAYGFSDKLYSMFLGDDSLVALMSEVDTSRVVRYMGNVFNLSAKAMQNSYGYFCSAYIVKVDGVVRYVADPLKRVEKLGFTHARDEETMRENFISFQDIMRNYDDEATLDALDECVRARLKLKFSVKPMLHALYTVSVDYDEYRKLFSTDLVHVIN